MIIYAGLKKDFMESCEKQRIADIVRQNFRDRFGRDTSEGEIRSWKNSLNYMYIVLNDPEIPDDAGVAIEYTIPQTSKRIDFILSGYDAEGCPVVIIIELKQWEELEQIEGMGDLVKTFVGGSVKEIVHPSYQAWSYAELLRDYIVAVQDGGIRLYPCAYLHNYVRRKQDPVNARQYQARIVDAPVFTKGELLQLRELVKKTIRKGDGKEVIRLIDQSEIRPSKSLQDKIASMMKGNKEFIMIDDQKVAYEKILKISGQSREDGKKRTVIVQGGPGTGKTVIAVNLLAELTMQGRTAQYVSRNSAPRQVYLRKLKGQAERNSVDNLFKGAGIYVGIRENAVDTILADEAHRLSEKSGIYHNYGENQIREIIHAARCSVFFIDESQRVTMDDIGSVAEIEKQAQKEDAEVTYLELESQFRCNGSDGYLAWIDDVLQIRETANHDLKGLNYDLQIFDSPNEMRAVITERNKIANRSRILAGYCWDWVKQEKNNTNYHDIRIGDFEMSWNLDNGEPFAVGETSINEVGCIHTAQGLEFDYVGVIMGDDIRYENGRVITDYTKRAKTDQSLRGIKKLYAEDPETAKARADEIIKNTYRTLMTRGMKGCYIYCTDPGMREYLKKRLEWTN